MTVSQNLAEAIYWIRIHYLGAILIPATFLHFNFIFSGMIYKNYVRVILIGSYFVALCFIFISFSGQLAIPSPKPPFNFYTDPGLYYNYYSAYFVLCVAYSHYLLYRQQQSASGYERNRIKFLFLGTAIGFIGGSMAFLPVYNVPIFPYGVYLVAIYIFMVGYSITVFKLMDFNLLMRLGIGYGATLVVLGILLVMIIFLSESLIAKFFQDAKFYPTLIATGLLVFMYDPLRRKMIKFVDQIIFKSPDFNSVLSGIREKLKESHNIRDIASGLTEKFREIWNVDHAGFAMWNLDKSCFDFLPEEAFEHQIVNVSKEVIDRRDYLVKTLESERRLFPYGIVVDEDLISLNFRASAGERATFGKMRRTLRWLGASVVIPLMLDTELIGFIVLGPKKNKGIYNEEDKKFLSHVSEILSETIKKIILSQPVNLTQLKTGTDS